MALVDDIQRLYIAYFNRPADTVGLAYWTTQANLNGGSTAGIANAFSASTEYKTKYNGLSTSTLVNTIYLNLFGRGAEPAGLQYWGSRLDGGTFNVGNIVIAILSGAQNADAVAVNNKALAAVQFTQNLTTTAQISAYTTPAATALALTWLNAVVDPASLATALQGLPAVIVTIVGGTPPVTGGGGTPSITFTMTAGTDSGATFLGGAGNDTYNAPAGTFNALDSINGGAGTNILNITETSAISLAAGTVTVANIQTANVTTTSSVALDTTGWTGLTALNLVGVQGAVALTTAAATAVAVTETGTGQLATSIAVDGGSTVNVTSIHNTGGTITIGSTTAPTGAVVVNSSVDAAQTGGLITVNGGTTVNVTQTATNPAGTNVSAESAVTVNGGAATTAVTVTQAPVAAGASAVTAVAGTQGVAAVTAAPGTAAVAAVGAVSAVDAVAAVSGVSANGAVTIVDSKYNTAAANTITAVTLTNYGAGSVIRDNALAALSLAGTAGTLTITNATNAGGVPTSNTKLALTLNSLSGNNTITDTNNEITTLNVTTTGADSKLSAFSDTGLTTLTIAGTNVLTLGGINNSLTSISVSGAAGFNDGGTTAANGFAARGAAATLTTTSSGAIIASLDSTTQSFIGSTGKDTIRISSQVNATQTITGGSGTTDELILEGGAYSLTGATGLKVTGFETLGIAANVTGSIDMSQLATGFTGLHIIGNSNIAFTKVATGTSLKLDVASTSVSYGLASTTGASSSVNVILGGATSDTVNFGTIVLKDANSVGIGTVNLVSNGVNITAGDSTANNNTLVLTDNGLSTLNFSGTQGLAITTLNQASTQATSITLNNTNTSSFGLVIGTLTDTVLGSLTFTGSGLSTVATLTDSLSSALTISNTGSQLATVGTFTSSANLTSLTLNGNVQIGDGLVGGTGLTATSTSSITVSGATDNAHVKLSLGAAAAGQVHNVTLGNGNNVVTDATTAGMSNITVGTGSNFLTVGGATTNTTGLFTINLGVHTLSNVDYITVGTGGTSYASAANYLINGVSVGDRIIFNTDAAATLVGHTAGVITQTTAGVSLAATITAIETAVDNLAAHGVAYAVFGGNTYVAESISSTLGGTDTTIVQISGVHTVTAGASGYVMIAS